LARLHHAGPYYPLFVLANSDGEIFYRWEGYTTTGRFIGSLKTGLADLVTIDERIERNNYNPNTRDINFLAKHYADMDEYLESNKYYRMIQNKSGSTNSFLIFQNYADAIWNGKLPFDSIYVAADAVIDDQRTILDNIRKLAMMMSNLARRNNRTGDIGKYLQVGIDATAGSQNEVTNQYHYLIMADYDLYISHDTISALINHQNSMGSNWQNDPAKYYTYGKWCFDRRFNLDEAEKYVRIACQKASEGSFRAKHLSLLAEICYARGKTAEAIRQIKKAIYNDPENEAYQKRLEQLKDLLRK